MEQQIENSNLVEPKKQKKKINVYSNQRNKVIKKLANDPKDKLLNMANSNFKSDPCSSTGPSIVILSSNTGSTINIDNNYQNNKQCNSVYNNFESDCYLTSLSSSISKVMNQINSSQVGGAVSNSNTNQRINNDELSLSGFKNIQRITLKHQNFFQHFGSEETHLSRCCFCHVIMPYNILTLNEHAAKCKKHIESNLNHLRRFTCIVCDKTMRTLKHWKLHVISPSHFDNCVNENNNVSFDCGGCKVFFFGNKEQILNHCKTVHKNPSGLPYIFKCLPEVFHELSKGNQKCWVFCSPCKQFSTSHVNCSLQNKPSNKNIKYFHCGTCSIDFICTQDVYNKHWVSCEHFMLEHLKAKIGYKPNCQSIDNLKLPPIFLNRFTLKNEKAVCNDCSFQMVSNEETISFHLTKCIPKSNLGGKNTTNINKFFCVVCNEEKADFSEWKLHLISSSHLIKCHKFDDLVSYSCTLCSLHCYGSICYVYEHQNIHSNSSEENLSHFMAFNYKRINKELKSKDYYYCEDCETYSVVNSSDHWNKSHKTKLKRLVCQPCRVEFLCIEENNLFDRHILSSEHIVLKYMGTNNLEQKPLKSSLLNDELRGNTDSLCIQESIKSSFSNTIKTFSNWFVEDKNKVICKSCNDSFSIDRNVLISHMLACEQDLTTKNLAKNFSKTNINSFKCLSCPFITSDCKTWETHAISHVQLRISGLYSYFCKCCSSLLYGNMNDIEYHLNNEHSTVISEVSIETMMAKQFTRRNDSGIVKELDIMSYCEPCKKIFKTFENPNHFNTDSHLSIASDTVELFYCKYCQVEIYSSSTTIECHKMTAEHIILSLKYSELDHNDLPKALKLDAHLLKYAASQVLYEKISNIGFFCFVCDYLCTTLDIWKTHINGKKHVNSSKQSSCMNHRCKICKILLFGKRNDMFEHYDNKLHSVLKMHKSLAANNVQKGNDMSWQKNKETKHVCNIEPHLKSNLTVSDNIITDKTPNKDEINSFQKMLDKLYIQSNDQQDCSTVGESVTHSLTKATNHSLGLNDVVSNILKEPTLDVKTNSLKEPADDVKTNLLNKTPNIFLQRSIQNYSHSYELKIKLLKESISQKKEISQQKMYYCVVCDFITLLKDKWTEHNSTVHLNEIPVRKQLFCDTCNLHQVGPTYNLNAHYNTTEHKNVVEILKIYNQNKSIDNKTKQNDENKINLLLNKPSSVTKTNDKPELSNNQKLEKESAHRKVMIEIKSAKNVYKKNSWAELKKVFAPYGHFGVYPKNNSVLINFRKWASVTQMLNDKEKIEKEHDFTINILEPEEEKLPDLHKITEYEFGHKDTLVKIIDTQLMAINQEISNSDISQRLMLLISSIHRCSGHHFIGSKTYPFGSRMSGLALKESDVDLYFDIANTFYGSLSNDLHAQEDLVRYFGKVFRSLHNEFKQVQLITGARVPIVKFLHGPSGLNCDLSFKSGLSTHNTKLVRLYLMLDKRVHWTVCAVVKRWALQNNLKNQTMFTSYALAWLVLFYLMTINVVPPLKLFRDNAVYFKDTSRNQILDEMFIEDWDCTFCSQEKANSIWKVPDVSNWELLLGFFKFYSDPDRLKKFVFCPAIGVAIPKEQFIDIPMKTPDVLGFYKKKTGNASQWCNKLKINFSGEGLAVQDPFDLFHNITKAISPRKLQCFSHLCCKTSEVMTKVTQPYYA